MRKRVRLTREGIGWYCTCPVCGHPQATNENMPWCSKCGTEYNPTMLVFSNGRVRYLYVVFDTELKTPKYAWGKALNRAGGVRIGKPDK